MSNFLKRKNTVEDGEGLGDIKKKQSIFRKLDDHRDAEYISKILLGFKVKMEGVEKLVALGRLLLALKN